MKVTILLALLMGVWAEPPSNYLPPQARNSLSSQYGPPSQKSFSYNSLADNNFSRSKDRFGSFQGLQAPSSRQFEPSSNYQAPSTRFGSSQQDHHHGASARFGPSQSRQAPAARQFGSQGYQPPASSYQPNPRPQYGPPQPQSEYGAPFGRNKLMDDDLAEPANYEYNYEVQAAEESGAEFGHQETREDDVARGEYHVLLPDGRMQIVEYEADEEGFRPKIRYEEVGYPDARSSGPY